MTQSRGHRPPSAEADEALAPNGDNTLDVAVASRLSNTVSIFLGNANGPFASAITATTGTRPLRVAAATSTATASCT